MMDVVTGFQCSAGRQLASQTQAAAPYPGIRHRMFDTEAASPSRHFPGNSQRQNLSQQAVVTGGAALVSWNVRIVLRLCKALQMRFANEPTGQPVRWFTEMSRTPLSR